MKFLNKFIVSIIFLCAIILTASYFAFLNTLPKTLNSQEAQIKYSDILTQKIGYASIVRNFKLKTHPNLSFDIFVEKIYVINNREKLVNIQNLKYHSNLFAIYKGNLNADYIFADVEEIKKNLPQKKSEKKGFNIKYFPSINVDKLSINLGNNSKVDAENIKTIKQNHQLQTTLNAKIITPYTKSPIILGQDGKILYKKDFSFEDLSLQLGVSKMFISGDKNKLSLYGKNLSVAELEGSFLYFYKLKHPNKKNFIENFSNFGGTLDINLDYTKAGFNGECVAKNLSADFWTRKIAVNLPRTIFHFKDREITAQTQGTFGSEPVKTDFHLSGLATKNLHIEGNVYSKFTNKIVKKYFPEISIKGITDPKVKYTVNNGAVDVFYTLVIPKGSNLISNYGNLENINTQRTLNAHTYKNGETIYLKSFDYTIDGQKIFTGDGIFEKENGKYKPASASIKSIGKISISTIKSFLKNYINNGTFDADLKYNFNNKVISGGINLYDIYHSDFLYLKNTSIKVEKNNLVMNSDGTFYNSPISASFNADNNFKNGLLIHDIDIHLKKFVLQKGVMKDIPLENLKNKQRNTSDYNIEIKQGRLKVDEIYHRQFDITNVEIQGNLKNHIVKFIMPKANYAGGLLSAKGTYDVKKHNSDIEAFASDIDSNLAATRFFKLKDQIQGIAYATAHVITKNKLNDIKANVVFAVDDGFLPKLGSTEFIISKSKNKKENDKKKKFKFTLAKISNIDFSKPNVFYSNLYGGFALDNEFVKNVKIYSKSDNLSMFIEGDYDIDTEYGNLFIWGKHNKTASKKIRILKIPINLIYRVVFRPEHTLEQYNDKIKQIPPIKTKITDDISTFRVYVSGDLNSDNKIKVELKDLR